VSIVVAAGTLWGLISLVFLLWALGAPVALSRTASGLLSAEFVALLAWAYSREDCVEERCGTSTDVLHGVAFQDIPALSIAFLLATLVYARRASRARASRRRA
jgi:hypothetical protein